MRGKMHPVINSAGIASQPSFEALKATWCVVQLRA